MKKLLNLTAITCIIAGGSASAINIGSNYTQHNSTKLVNTTNNDGLAVGAITPQDIINNITNKSIYIAAVSTPINRDTSNAATIKVLKATLQKFNPLVQTTSLAYLSFAKTTLKENGAVTVKVTASLASKTASADLEVTLIPSAQSILNRITNSNILLPSFKNYVVPPSTSDALTISLLKLHLFRANNAPNIGLTSWDLKQFSFSVVTLPVNSAVTVQVSATVNSKQAVKKISVTLYESPKTLLNLITNKNVSLAPTVNPNTSNADTIKAMTSAIRKNNPGLTDREWTFFSFAKNITLVKNKAVTVLLTAKVNDIFQSMSLAVTLGQTPQGIINKITNNTIVLHNFNAKDTYTSNLVVIKNLKSILRTNNPALSSDDLDDITFSKVQLVVNKAIAVTITATMSDQKSASKQINVVLAPETAVNIANKVAPNYVYGIYGPKIKAKVIYPDTPIYTAGFRHAIWAYNAPTYGMSKADVQLITFAHTPLVVGRGSDVLLTVTMPNGTTATATANLGYYWNY